MVKRVEEVSNNWGAIQLLDDVGLPTDEAFSARWWVAKTGYGWLYDERLCDWFTEQPGAPWEVRPGVLDEAELDLAGPYLVANPGSEAVYDPLSRHGLHRELAELTPERDAIARFANKHGLLTGGEEVPDDIVPGVRGLRVEHLNVWKSAIVHLRDLLGVWDAVQAYNRHELQRRFVWNLDPGNITLTWRRWLGDSFDFMLADSTNPATRHRIGTLKPGDVYAPARHALALGVTAGMLGNVSAVMIPGTPSRITVTPHHLLAAMYAQLAFEMTGRVTRSRRCAHCNKTLNSTRRNKIYCDKRCRQNASTARRSESRGASPQVKARR